MRIRFNCANESDINYQIRKLWIQLNSIENQPSQCTNSKMANLECRLLN